jgi:uncharacterized protein (TIGR03382 family)
MTSLALLPAQVEHAGESPRGEKDMKKMLALALVAAAAGTASAATVDVNLAGWSTFGGFNAPGNTNTSISLPIGTQITGVEWIDLTFTAIGQSYRSELVLSVNDSLTGPFWDYNPADGIDTPGPFGPSSGVFTNPGFLGGAFTMTTGSLYIEAYESFNDGGNAVQDAAITSGILRITFIPTPGTAALLGLGGLAAMRRRR